MHNLKNIRAKKHHFQENYKMKDQNNINTNNPSSQNSQNSHNTSTTNSLACGMTDRAE